ncbi:hypothetical protein JK628_13085 [Shewanella sp. KX20019]|jgi:hypothetical protein|uniref:hypothetical protein n=1 Tax=Shewanella sp. KX20019 TaxID=2803864 RepID=UPI0019267E4A|nr:hypothetical protein [Shewanella sp. KX20019]QQX78516.1 hypothetical protein JK628_13085 [Shewanella sp. KX20019]
MQVIDTIQPKLQQLIWLNRNNQKKVLANSKRASNGALIVNQTLIPSGLPIELGTKDSGLDRADFEALQQHNATVLTAFTLKLDNETMQVIWDNSGDAVSGIDLFDQVNGYDLVTNVVLRFLTV